MTSDTEKKIQKQQGKRLQEARERAGFKTGSAAARALGIPVASYNQYENGTRGIFSIADDLAKRLGVSRDWLLEGGPDRRLDEIYRELAGLPESERDIAVSAALGAIRGISRRN